MQTVALTLRNELNQPNQEASRGISLDYLDKLIAKPFLIANHSQQSTDGSTGSAADPSIKRETSQHQPQTAIRQAEDDAL